MTGYLRSTATSLAALLAGTGGYKFDSPLKAGLKVAFQPVIDFSKISFEAQQAQGVVIILISGVLIVGALFLLVRVMRATMQSRVEAYITQFLGRSAVLSMFFGAIVTVMVQSSSITTSLLVPLAGAGVITLAQAFPLTLGANIGTTVTALLASLAATGENAEGGVIIALVHLLFNLTGIVMIYPIAALRNIPLAGARWFAEVAVKSRRWALVYVLVLFYGLPAFFAFLDRYL
jgi:sodium-dependent phosphate cotransporter